MHWHRRTLAAVGLIAAMAPAAAGACSLTVGWEPWAPYQVPTDDGGPTGLDIELVRHIAERAGCDVTFERRPWSRLLAEIKRGDMDAAMAAAKNEERAAYGHFTEPYRSETVGLMVRAGDESILTKDSLRDILDSGHTIGMWRDYHYGEKVERLRNESGYADNFTVVDQGRTLLRMLAGERFDATLGDPVADTHTANKLGLREELTVHGLTVLETPVHLLLSKASVPRDTRERLNRAIESAKADGALERIVDSYMAN